MADSSERYDILFKILEAIAYVNIDDCDDIENEGILNGDKISRGPPCDNRSKRCEISDRIKINMKRKTIINKFDTLKDIIQQKNETRGITIMASLINEILDPTQLNIFKMELESQGKDYMENPEYIPFVSQDNQVTSSYMAEYKFVARSGAPNNSIVREDVFDSMNIHEDSDRIKLPLDIRYNPSEVFLIHKGIHYCKILLAKHNHSNDNQMLVELKSKNVLKIVMEEKMNNDKSYISTLVDNYPRSFDEIKFILMHDKEVLFESSIFASMAQKSVQSLYELLVKLSSIMDENELSRACIHSQVNGINLETLLQQDYPPDIRSFAEKITRFLNRYKQGQTF